MKTIALAILIALVPGASLAEKITVDPNTQKPAPTEQEQPDERLAQRMTYTSTGKRLHTVLDEISAKTGVTIKCGDGKDDWKVRDLPIVVCAKDLPLGKLLRAIADCTHLLLTSSKIDGVKQYRIWRDSVREKTIANYLRKQDEHVSEWGEYEWDLVSKLGSMPDSEIKVDPAEFKKHGGGDFANVLDFARIMASMPADAKQRAFAGERIKVKAKDLPPELGTRLRNLYQGAWDQEERSNVEAQRQAGKNVEPRTLPESDLESAMLTFYVTQGDRQVFRSVLGNGTGYGRNPAVDTPNDLLSAAIPGWPKPPPPVEEPKYAFGKGMSTLDDARKAGEYLGDTIEVKKPDLKREIVFSDRVAAVSDASGYSMVCEDFPSYYERGIGDDSWGLFERKRDLNSAIQCLSIYPAWQVDKNSKLLVGSEKAWCEKHSRMVPESFIQGLMAKLDGNGVELDDAVAIVGLTWGQYADWILDKRELGWVAWAASRRDEPFWKLYNSLSSYDKERAKSKTGLSLGKFDPWYLVTFFKESADGVREDARDSGNPMREILMAVRGKPDLEQSVEKWLREAHPDLGAQDATVDYDQLAAELTDAFPGIASTNAIPTDPAVIGKLILRIEKMDMKPSVRITESRENGQTTRWENVENGIRRRHYNMSITGPGVNLLIGGPMPSFPVHSSKREIEVYKELQKKAKPRH